MADAVLKVLAVIADLHVGGGENRILNVARAIDPSRFRYSVATLYPRHAGRDCEFGNMQDEFEKADIKVVNLGLRRPDTRNQMMGKLAAKAVAGPMNVVTLRRFVVEQEIDLIDAHLAGALLTAIPAAKAAGTPVVATLYHALPGSRWSPMNALSNACLRMADAVFTDSRIRAKELARIAGSAKPMFVIPNGVRLPPPSRSRAAMLAELGIPAHAFVIGQVSGFAPSKGHATLLQAAKRVLSERPDSYFFCVGYTRGHSVYVESLRKEAAALGIGDRVRFAAYPGCIADVWSLIDVHAHASHFDSLPNAIIEAMSLAKPSVVTDTGGVGELVEHERTGLLVRPGDQESLAQALLRLLNDPGYARRLGRSALQRYENHYTPEVTARAIEDSFIKVIECSHRDGRESRSVRVCN